MVAQKPTKTGTPLADTFNCQLGSYYARLAERSREPAHVAAWLDRSEADRNVWEPETGAALTAACKLWGVGRSAKLANAQAALSAARAELSQQLQFGRESVQQLVLGSQVIVCLADLTY